MGTIKTFIYDKPEWLILYIILIVCTGVVRLSLLQCTEIIRDFLKYTNGLLGEINEGYSLYSLEESVDRIKELLERKTSS